MVGEGSFGCCCWAFSASWFQSNPIARLLFLLLPPSFSPSLFHLSIVPNHSFKRSLKELEREGGEGRRGEKAASCLHQCSWYCTLHLFPPRLLILSSMNSSSSSSFSSLLFTRLFCLLMQREGRRKLISLSLFL